MEWISFTAGIGYSLLPKQWRGRHSSATIEFARAGVVSGLLEMVVFGSLTLNHFARFMVARSKLVADAPMNEGTQLWVLAIFIVDFLIQPLSIVLVYFTLEGFARGYTAWLHGNVLPSLPLFLVATWQARHRQASAERSHEPRLGDVVEEVSPGELRILTCRPKDWASTTTIAYRQEMWEVVKTGQTAGARKFAYHLRLRRSNVAIRAIREYDPEHEPSS